MSYAPDFGLAMMRNGCTQEQTIYMYSFHLGRISLLEDGRCSTTIQTLLGEEWHALTVDFDAEQFGLMLDQGAEENYEAVRSWMDASPFVPSFELPKPFDVGVALRLGEICSNSKEQYLPLVVTEVLAPGEPTEQGVL